MRPLMLIHRLVLVCLLLATQSTIPIQAQTDSTTRKTLTVYCAAGLKKSVEAIALNYEKETGTQIQLQYGGSGELLSSLQASKQGDIFIAADASYIKKGKEEGLIEESLVLSQQKPVLAVKAGNPKKITSVDDLIKSNDKYALANPETASIGKICQRVFTAKGSWEELAKHVTVMKPTVSDIANDLTIGTVDAAFVWDATVQQIPGMEIVPLPEFAGITESVMAGILKSAKDPTLALHFARYLAAPDKGGVEFKNRGYSLVENDPWQDKPEIKIFIGTVNRLAVQKSLQDFSTREGVAITTVFNGCGILCATMRSLATTKGAKIPDAYLACDICFVKPVADLYPEAVLLSDTDILIAVKKGNPKNVHFLADLARPGLKVGLANFEQSSLGFITKHILEHAGLYDSINANASSEVPAGDLLVNQLLVGSLDAVIVYTVNALPHADILDTIAIKSEGARAVQPFAVAQNSPNRQTAKRLLAYLQEHKENYRNAGFRWRVDQTPVASNSLPAFGSMLPAVAEQPPTAQGKVQPAEASH